MSHELENVLYEEKQATYKVFFLIFAVSLGVTIFVLFRYINSITNDVFMIIIWLAVLLEVLILSNFIFLKIKVTDQYLKFGFGFFKRKFKFEDIQSIEIKDYNFSNYFGYGIRVGRDKTVAFAAKGGKGLLITLKAESLHKKKNYFVSSDQTDQLFVILDPRINK